MLGFRPESVDEVTFMMFNGNGAVNYEETTNKCPKRLHIYNLPHTVSPTIYEII